MDRYALHTRTSQLAAARVIEEYSTSFSLATRLLPGAVRTHITSIYALVRVADEVVDGAFPHSAPQDRMRVLDDLEERVRSACASGFSTDPYVHAFAWTARRVGIGPGQWEPFFDSMRTDAVQGEHGEESLRSYVYGSAEVVGEMCVLSFLDGAPVGETRRQELMHGARALGSAFQKVNFLRDLGEDSGALERSYFPGVGAELTEARKMEIVAEIRAELVTARAVIPLLPARVRPAVLLAHDLFAELCEELSAAPAAALAHTRVSVPTRRKAALAAGAALSGVRPALAVRRSL